MVAQMMSMLALQQEGPDSEPDPYWYFSLSGVCMIVLGLLLLHHPFRCGRIFKKGNNPAIVQHLISSLS